MKICLVENFGADFVSARLRFASFLKKKGFDVVVIIPADGHKLIIESKGIRVIEVAQNIRKKGFFSKLDYANRLRTEFKKGKFDIIHLYRLQPNLIGTIVAGISCNSKIINHITGLGIAFSKRDFISLIQKNVIKFVYKINHFLFKPFYIFQNEQDIVDLNINSRVICIKGSSVNEDKFNLDDIKHNSIEILDIKNKYFSQTKESKTFLFVSRIIKEKGVQELIEGFALANNMFNNIHNLIIIGWSDLESPSSISNESVIKLIGNSKNIKFIGKQSNIELFLTLSDVSILPTYYREGTPRFLLESMVMHKPIITTNMPGCSHLVEKDINGILIEPRSSLNVSKAIQEILKMDLLTMGIESYKLYKEYFSEAIVFNQILEVYKK